jgi:uncharacterized protein (DUF362 family)
MGAVYDEFKRELATWKDQYAGQPRREMIRLFLLALEREELVSVGYRETAIVRRLNVMPLTPAIREIIRHALLWVWKDEEMHAIYIRGAILKLGSFRLRITAFVRQLAGAVGGWSASVRHHARWSEAPLSRALATCNTWAGSLLGKVPADVREHLRYGPFRRFCHFNIDAERTALLCWSRLLELAESQPEVTPHLVDDFRRIMTDEDRHGQVFQILADALGEDDRLVPGESAATLAHKIGVVGEFFLPRELRPTQRVDSPLGGGGPVFVMRGQTAQDKRPLFRRLLDEACLPTRLTERAKVVGKSVREFRVAVKPTFMLGYHRKDRSIITDPELLDDLAHYLRDQGCADVAVVEAPNIYDQFYTNRSVGEVARYFGITSPHYRLVDLSEEQVPHVYFRGMAQYTIGRTWKEADFRISFGKMRSHAVEMVHLTLGNVEWVGARCDEFLFPERQAHRETAVMMLLDEFPPHFAILDAYDQAADGLVGMMGCPRPPSPMRLYAGADALALDLLAARHLGMTEPGQSRILQSACQWFGDPTGHARLVGTDEPVKGWRSPYHNELSTLLSFFAYPVYQWGSGRGTLFVPEMDEKAFRPKQPASAWLRFRRSAVQSLLGLRHRK